MQYSVKDRIEILALRILSDNLDVFKELAK